MSAKIKRREFITLLGGAAAAWPLAARAQRPAKLPTIGYLGSSTASPQSQWVAAFVQRLHDLGWMEGRTIAIEYRWAEGRTERFQEIAGEFARLKVDVIVTSGTAPALAAKQAAPNIPIVFAVAEIYRRRFSTVLFDLVLNGLPFVERAQASTLNGRDMNKHVPCTLRTA
jgi:ABC transporter substrate binding protein